MNTVRYDVFLNSKGDKNNILTFFYIKDQDTVVRVSLFIFSLLLTIYTGNEHVLQ